MQKLLTEFEIEKSKISTKGWQRLVIIPRKKHNFLEKLEDKPYLIEITIMSIKEKKKLFETLVIGKISTMGVQRHIHLPLDIHDKIKNLKEKYCIKIVIRERS